MYCCISQKQALVVSRYAYNGYMKSLKFSYIIILYYSAIQPILHTFYTIFFNAKIQIIFIFGFIFCDG